MTTKNKINTEIELQNLVEYLNQTWVFPDNFSNEKLVNLIEIPFKAGLEAAKDWCKDSNLCFALYDLLDERVEYIEKEHEDFLLYDGFYQMLNNLIDGLRTLEKASTKNWSYDKFCRDYIVQARELIGDQQLHPKPYGSLIGLSYDKIREDFEDFDTLGYWDEDDKGLTQEDKEKSIFKGFHFDSSNFIGRTTLHYILHSDINQDRDPLKELIMAVIAHALEVAQFNNTVGAFETVKEIKLPQKFMYELPELPKHKLLIDCYNASNKNFRKRTPEVEKALSEHKTKLKTLTPEQIQENKNRQFKDLEKMIKDIIE